MPTARCIMILRHGEKPEGDDAGVDHRGQPSPHSLRVRGWERAGALCSLFSSTEACRGRGLEQPQQVFAASPEAKGAEPGWHSLREEETGEPVAQRLGLQLNKSFGKGQEAEAARAAMDCAGTVLLVWEHGNIPRLARCLAPDAAIPESWPSHRYDMVFVFRLQGDRYAFAQVPELLLAGDSAEPIG